MLRFGILMMPETSVLLEAKSAMSRRSPFERAKPWLIPGLLAVWIVLYLYPALHSVAYIGNFQDDFFYYLVAAKHILSGQGSTFDGTHQTNGYHPLWMLVIIIMSFLFHGQAFFYAFSVLAIALIL